MRKQVNYLSWSLLYLIVTLSFSCTPHSVATLNWSREGMPFHDSLSNVIEPQLECFIWSNKPVYEKTENPRLGVSLVNKSKFNIVLPAWCDMFQLYKPSGRLIVTTRSGRVLNPYPTATCGNVAYIDTSDFIRVGPGQTLVVYRPDFRFIPDVIRPGIVDADGPITVRIQLEYSLAVSDSSFWYRSSYCAKWTDLRIADSAPPLKEQIPADFQRLLDKVPRVTIRSNVLELTFR